VVESHLLQISTIAEAETKPVLDSGEGLGDIFNVFTAERQKKCADKASNLPELITPTPPASTSPLNAPNALPRTPNMSKPSPQYRYHSDAKNQHLISELQSWLMEGKLSHTTPVHVFAASPSIRRDVCDKLKV